MYNIDVILQGLYKVGPKVKITNANYTALQDILFGGGKLVSDGDYITMDYEAYAGHIATEAVKGADPNRVNFGKEFNEKAIWGQYYNDDDYVEVSQALNRVSMDEPIDAPWSTEERLISLLADKRDKIVESHKMSAEKACADALITGGFATRIGGTQSFPISNSLLSVSGSSLNTDPIGCLTTAATALAKKKGGMPTKLILNPLDAARLMKSSAVVGLADIKNLEGLNIDFQAMKENGMAFLGIIPVPIAGRVQIFAYNGYYTSGGTDTYYIPQGKALFVPDVVGAMGNCGVFVKNGNVTGKIGVEHGYHVWAEDKHLPGTCHIQVQSAPCPIITAIDRYCVLTSIPNS